LHFLLTVTIGLLDKSVGNALLRANYPEDEIGVADPWSGGIAYRRSHCGRYRVYVFFLGGTLVAWGIVGA